MLINVQLPPRYHFLLISGTWNPSWSVATILTGLLSFMLETTETTGSIRTKESEKIQLAKASKRWNRSQPNFCRIFPELVDIDLGEDAQVKVVTHKEKPVNNVGQPTVSGRSTWAHLFKYLLLGIPVLFAYLVFLKLSSRALL